MIVIVMIVIVIVIVIMIIREVFEALLKTSDFT